MRYFSFNSAVKKWQPATLVPASDVFPKGMITPFAGTTAPPGWLICDGSTFSATAYPQLAAVLGNTYGAVSGDNYYLPDLRGRAPIGAGTGKSVDGTANLTARALGAKISNAESVTLTAAQSGVPAHSHANTVSGTFASSGHAHGPGSLLAAIGATNSDAQRIGYVATGVNGPSQATYSNSGVIGGLVANPNAPFNHYTAIYGATDGPNATASVSISNVDNATAPAASSHENMQPSIVLNYIIKA